MVQPDSNVGLEGSSANGAGALASGHSQAPIPPPKAKSMPLLGSAPWMLRDPVQFVLQAAREHGPLVRIPLGPRTLTLISHPEDMRRVLHQDHENYPRGQTIDPIRPMLRNSLPTSDGQVWRRKRRILQPAFNRSRLNLLVGTMAGVTQRYLDGFSHGQRLDASELMMRLTRDVIVATMFSGELGSDTAALDQALADLEHYISRYMFVPFAVPMWLPTPDNFAFRRAIATLDRLVIGLAVERRKSGSKKGDLLDGLLAARDAETGEAMPDQEIRDELVSIFFAGHETTANALTWTTHLISTHPEVFARLREEADRVLGDRTPTADDVLKLDYAAAVLREALRLYPPGWITGRTADRDDVLRGYAIKKGDMLGICPLITHRLPEFWPDPERFDPERFTADPSGGNRDFTYLPFGTGPHMCIGTHFAMMEAAIVLAMTVRSGQLVVEQPEKVRMKSTITLQVAGGLPVRVEQRAGARA
jgi:cytochrome P450